MQVQAPQIVVQYDYNIYVYSMCHDLRMRDENCLDPGPSRNIRCRHRTVGQSNQECKETSRIKCVSHVEKVELRFLHTKKL